MSRCNIILLVLLLSLKSIAQNLYTITKTSASYSAVVGGTVVSGTTPWSSFAAHTVPLGFNFNYFGTNYSTIYCEGSGFCIFDIALYEHTIHPYTVQMRDAGTGSSQSQSPISYILSGTAPNRICKIQWSNCEMSSNLGSFANFQLWLYETTNIIEARIGNCTITNPALAFQSNGFDGPLVAIYNTKTTPDYGYCVQGSNPNETFNIYNSGTISNIFQASMSAPPPSGMVYRFSPGNTTGLDENTTSQDVRPYPNPCKNEVHLSLKQNTAWQIYNAVGELLLEGKNEKEQFTISFASLSRGIYFIKVEGKTYRLIKDY
jgi:hypothetical protein